MPKTKSQEEKERRREETMKEALESKDFYNMQPLLDKDGDINIIWGQRSNGKSYSALKYALENFHKSQRTFVYVRRWAEDISVKNMDKLMSPLPVETIFGKGKSIRFYRGAFWLQDEDPAIDKICIGWAISLNQVAHTKSQTFTGAQVVILDEFLQLATERKLKDEFDAWEQTLSTILRTTQDAKIFILGNSIGKYTEYFTPYGVDPNAIKQGEVKEIFLPNEYGSPTKVVAEYCEYNEKIGQRTSKYVRGSKMARTGEWEIPDVANIPHCDNETAQEDLLCTMYDSVMNITIGIFDRYAVWSTLEKQNGLFVSTPHEREFLVIRETNRQSSFFHLTKVKDLKYNTYSDANKMFRDIKEYCDIDILDELQKGRVYCENSFVGDYFYHTYCNYLNVSTRELL